MRRIVITAVLAAIAFGSLLLAQQNRPMFQASVVSVVVDVTVLRGRTPVAGLGVADFTLTDNGVPQTIESISHGTIPLDLTIVLDFSNSSRGDFDEFVRNAADMQRFLGPEDQWRWLGVFSEPREMVPMRPATDPLPTIAPPGPVHASALADTVFLALVRPGQPARRHLVIVYTDGHDSWSILEPKRLPEIASQADAVLYAVTTSAPPPVSAATGGSNAAWSAARWRETQDALFDAVRETGGSIHRLSNRADAFGRIIQEFRSAYVLRYTPQGVDTPGWHTLTVSVAQPRGLTIRARRGYER